MDAFTNGPIEFEIEDTIVMKYFGKGGVVVIPDGVTDIFFQVFSADTSITELSIPGSISEITPLEFDCCTALTKVTFGDGVKSIGLGAFRGCTALTKIVIPKSLKSIEKIAFACCSSLKEICFGGSKDEWNMLQKGDYWDKGTGGYRIIYDYTEN